MTTVHPPAIKTAVLAAADCAAPVAANERLMLPAGVKPFQLDWPHLLAIAAYHGAALLGLHARLF
jgi:stearoyl-CoA desaturase (delta-9 desaturase)